MIHLCDRVVPSLIIHRVRGVLSDRRKHTLSTIISARSLEMGKCFMHCLPRIFPIRWGCSLVGHGIHLTRAIGFTFLSRFHTLIHSKKLLQHRTQYPNSILKVACLLMASTTPTLLKLRQFRTTLRRQDPQHGLMLLKLYSP